MGEYDENQSEDRRSRKYIQSLSFQYYLRYYYSTIGDILVTVRFEAMHSLCERFSVLWSSEEMTTYQIWKKSYRAGKTMPRGLRRRTYRRISKFKIDIFIRFLGRDTLTLGIVSLPSKL